MPRNRPPPAHRRQRVHREGRGHQRPQVRRAHLPHLDEERLGVREPVRRVQQLRELACGVLQGRSVQYAVQHEHLRQDVARRGDARAGARQDRRADRRRGHRRAAQPRGAGAVARRPRHLREAREGLHREAVGPRLQGSACVDHQAPAVPLHLRQQLLQRPLPGHPHGRLHEDGRAHARGCGSAPQLRVQGPRRRRARHRGAHHLLRADRRVLRLQARPARVPLAALRERAARRGEPPGRGRGELQRARGAVDAHHRAQALRVRLRRGRQPAAQDGDHPRVPRRLEAGRRALLPHQRRTQHRPVRAVR